VGDSSIGQEQLLTLRRDDIGCPIEDEDANLTFFGLENSG
jgi:hypothetical protein